MYIIKERLVSVQIRDNGELHKSLEGFIIENQETFEQQVIPFENVRDYIGNSRINYSKMPVQQIEVFGNFDESRCSYNTLRYNLKRFEIIRLPEYQKSEIDDIIAKSKLLGIHTERLSPGKLLIINLDENKFVLNCYCDVLYYRLSHYPIELGNHKAEIDKSIFSFDLYNKHI